MQRSEPGVATRGSAAPATELVVTGGRLTLRYAVPEDAPRLFELARDPAVTRFFSWGPYVDPEQAESYIAEQPGKRERGEILDFVIVDREHGVIGVTGLSEFARRDRRATIGSWLGHRYWGTGANRESKALVAALAFEHLGIERLTAWAGTGNGRSQAALERLGFRREGVLRAWHRHRGEARDVVVFGLLRRGWEAGSLSEVPVTVHGALPPGFVVV
jgi:[ribosomal protein S5]-alanine N-acetyltransferase